MPRIPIIQAGPAAPAPRATAAHFGGGEEAAATAEVLESISGITGKLFDAEMSARTSAASAAAAKELHNVELELRDDPDHGSHEAKYEKRKKEILDRHRKGLKFGQYQEIFDADTFQAVERGRINVKLNVRRKQMEGAIASLNRATADWVDLAGAAVDPDAREEYRNTALAKINEMEEDGVLNAIDAEARRQKLDIDIAEQVAARMIHEGPHGAAARFRDPNGPISALPRKRREELAEAAEAEARERDRIERARVQEIKAREALAQKELENEMGKEAALLISKGEMTTEWVATNRPNLTKEDYRAAVNAAANGGGAPGGNKLDEAEYKRLRNLEATDPATFANETLDAGKLGPTYTGFADAQARIKAGGQTTGLSWTAKVQKRLELLEIDESSKKQTEFWRSADAMIEQFEKDHGRAPTSREQTAILDELSIEVTRERFWWDVTVPLGLLGLQESPEEFSIPDVPEDQVQTIIEELRGQGARITARTIRDSYLDALRNGEVSP